MVHGPGERSPVLRVVRVIVFHRTSPPDGFGEFRPILPLPAQQIQVGSPIRRAPRVERGVGQNGRPIKGALLLEQAGAGEIAAKYSQSPRADSKPFRQPRDRPGPHAHDRKEIQIERGEQDAGQPVRGDSIPELIKRAEQRNVTRRGC